MLKRFTNWQIIGFFTCSLIAFKLKKGVLFFGFNTVNKSNEFLSQKYLKFFLAVACEHVYMFKCNLNLFCLSPDITSKIFLRAPFLGKRVFQISLKLDVLVTCYVRASIV